VNRGRIIAAIALVAIMAGAVTDFGESMPNVRGVAASNDVVYWLKETGAVMAGDKEIAHDALCIAADDAGAFAVTSDGVVRLDKAAMRALLVGERRLPRDVVRVVRPPHIDDRARAARRRCVREGSRGWLRAHRRAHARRSRQRACTRRRARRHDVGRRESATRCTCTT